MLMNYMIAIFSVIFFSLSGYSAVMLASFIPKLVLTNYLEELAETTRSRETKLECQKMLASTKSKYRDSLFWPFEIWRVLRGKK